MHTFSYGCKSCQGIYAEYSKFLSASAYPLSNNSVHINTPWSIFSEMELLHLNTRVTDLGNTYRDRRDTFVSFYANKVNWEVSFTRI